MDQLWGEEMEQIDKNSDNQLLETIELVRGHLATRKRKQIVTIFQDLHAADAADVIEALSSAERSKLVKIIRKTFDGSILAELEDDVRAQIMDQLKTTELVEAVSSLDSDDAVYVIEDMEQGAQNKVLQAIPKQDRHKIETALAFPEDSAGRIMQREMVMAPEHWTVDDAAISIKKKPEIA